MDIFTGVRNYLRSHTQRGGSLTCPRCDGKSIRVTDTLGDIDLYRCYTKNYEVQKVANWRGEVSVRRVSRTCGQPFKYRHIHPSLLTNVGPEAAKKNPELITGASLFGSFPGWVPQRLGAAPEKQGGEHALDEEFEW